MARPSFADPQITNPILTDVSVIRELFTVLAKINPSLADGTPDGAIRLIATSSDETLWQLQRYKNGGWATIGMLDHDVKGLGDYSVSTSAQPNTIPVYNSDAKLVGSITGNAETATKFQTPRNLDIGGIATATAQPFDGTADVTIPINSISVNNALDDAIIGVISKAHGGTGRNDGMADDVAFTTGAGATSAKATGQIGNGVALSDTTHLDSVIQPGHYGGGANWQNIGSPTIFSGTSILDVYRFDPGTIAQRFSNADNGEVWWRISRNNGANWGAWQPTTTSANIIYISKSGSDNNTGLDPAYPVLTFARAKQIAASSRAELIKFRFGAGDWGAVSFGNDAISGYLVIIGAYTEAATNAYSTEFPFFANAQVVYSANVQFLSCVFEWLNVSDGAYVYCNEHCFQRVKYMQVRLSSTFIKKSTGESIFEVNYIYVAESSTCIIYAEPHQWSNMDVWAHWAIGRRSYLYVEKAPVSNSYSWTGEKFNIGMDCATNLYLATLQTLTGTGYSIGIGASIGDGLYDIARKSLSVQKTGDTMSGVLHFTGANLYGDATGVNKPFITMEGGNNYWVAGFDYYGGANLAHFVMGLAARRADGTEISYNNIVLRYDGTWRVYCPTPPAGDNTNSIATTQWVRARISEAVSGLSSGGGGACPTTACIFKWQSTLDGARGVYDVGNGIATTNLIHAMFGKSVYGMRPANRQYSTYSYNRWLYAPQNGYFFWSWVGSGRQYWRMGVSSSEVSAGRYNSYNAGTLDSAFLCPVRKGAGVYVYDSVANQSGKIVFMPCDEPDGTYDPVT